MKTAAAWRAGAYTHPGLERDINEDRVLVDDGRGLFLVVDGLGGHAAGEVAAATAVRVIEENLKLLDSSAENVEAQLRLAIAAANNRIYELAQTHPEYDGMACVLTVAVASGDRIVAGHVGDSRLYLIWNGKIRKITSDHSPVGEFEDQGLLTEKQAMFHPRRNEVFRDVGSVPRQADDPQFVEVKNFLFRPDAALLLCSDGLSDCVPSVEINQIIERFDGDPAKTAQQLVEAANAAGGRDNISVVFVAGPEFLGAESGALSETRARHATTRMRGEASVWSGLFRGILLLLAGIAIGLLLRPAFDLLANHGKSAAPKNDAPVPHSPQTIVVSPADPLGITSALAAAQPGDTISIPPGNYLGPLQLKEHVNLIATVPRQAILRSDPSSSPDPGVALAAHSMTVARVRGLRIVGDGTHPLRVGVLLVNSSIELEDCEISGAADTGIRVEGDSHPLLLGNFIHGNVGPGVTIHAPGAPRLVGNRISENGSPEIRTEADAHPVLVDNLVEPNAILKKKPAAVKAKPAMQALPGD
jgi:serine/threonine protein phosphatase PrpC